jgi:hypothetical protein
MAPPRVPSRKWLEFEGGVISGCFGTVEIAVPRARIGTTGGGTGEWKSTVLPRYARMTKQIEALIAGAYLAGARQKGDVELLVALGVRRDGQKVLLAVGNIGGESAARSPPRERPSGRRDALATPDQRPQPLHQLSEEKDCQLLGIVDENRTVHGR